LVAIDAESRTTFKIEGGSKFLNDEWQKYGHHKVCRAEVRAPTGTKEDLAVLVAS
jgi:hypothetical protein